MTNKFAARCPRCEGTGRHQGGRCFQCKGKRVIGMKSSKIQKLFKHTFKIDGENRSMITWGKNVDDSFDVALIWLDEQGFKRRAA